MVTVARKLSFVLAVVILSTIFSLTGCNKPGNTTEVNLGIYLLDSGELVISDLHIEKYIWDTHTIELNDEGIEKWNSFISYKGIPKLSDTLYKRDFVLKVDDKEVYRGTFYSMLSSTSYDGVVILDAIMKLDGERNTIKIAFGYGPNLDSLNDPRNSLDMYDCLKEAGLLE